MNEKSCYSVKEVAQVMGIGENNAYELTRRKDFPKIQIGRRIVIPIEAFNKWLCLASIDGQARKE
jgi:excisionase family DNA binding protein